MRVGPFTVTPRRKRKRSIVVDPVRIRYPRFFRHVLDAYDVLKPPRKKAERKHQMSKSIFTQKHTDASEGRQS